MNWRRGRADDGRHVQTSPSSVSAWTTGVKEQRTSLAGEALLPAPSGEADARERRQGRCPLASAYHPHYLVQVPYVVNDRCPGQMLLFMSAFSASLPGRGCRSRAAVRVIRDPWRTRRCQ
jgi:hypothetical protein